MPTLKAYLLRETAIGAVINAVLSLAMFLLVFGIHAARIPVWGPGQFAFDFLPQSFGVSFMSTLMPGLIARRNLAGGRIAPVAGRPRLPRHLILRALLVGCIVAVICSLLWNFLLRLSGIQEIAWLPALIIKVAYGAILGSAVTPPTLLDILRQQ